jgi:predicted phosphodiesterase
MADPRFISLAVCGGRAYAVDGDDKKLYSALLPSMGPRKCGASASVEEAPWALASEGRGVGEGLRGVTVGPDGRICYAVGGDGKVYSQALEAMTVSSPWALALRRGTALAIAVSSDHVFVVGEDKAVYAQSLDAMTLGSRWTRVAPKRSALSIAVSGGIMYAVGLDHKINKLDLAHMTADTSWTLAARGRAKFLAADASAIYTHSMHYDGYGYQLHMQASATITTETPWTPLLKMHSNGIDVKALPLLLAPTTQRGTPSTTSLLDSLLERLAAGVCGSCGKRRHLEADMPVPVSYRVVCISDTHGQHRHLDLPRGDVLVHAGDLCGGRGEECAAEVVDVAAFFDELLRAGRFQHIVAIAGNHDLVLQDGIGSSADAERFQRVLRNACRYLQDEEVSLDLGLQGDRHEIRVYGTPWQPAYAQHDPSCAAFTLPRGSDSLRSKWNDIPHGIDILVTHGPPYKRRDETWKRQQVGCQDLLHTVQGRGVPPRVVVSGHIHEGYGYCFDGRTLFVNAACKAKRGALLNPPIVVDVPVDPNLSAMVVEPEL